jgi:LPS-assembly protein
MGRHYFLVAAVLLFASVPLVVRAQEPRWASTESQEIGVVANEISYDRKTDTVVARGDVVITRGEIELRADEVYLNRTTNEADARGNVRVTGPEGTIVADEMKLNLDDETGFLEHAEITSPRYRYSLWGDRIEKGLGQTYHIENGRFTTCHCTNGSPSWSLSGEDVRVTLGGYGTLRDGTFNVLDRPILYLPRAFFPVQRDRQSGFLSPRFGISNVRGFQTLLPFYWAIDKSQDATLAFDLETSIRVGLLGEYRYVLGHDSHGTLSGSYFNQSLASSPPPGSPEFGVPENRWSVLTEQDQALGEHSQAYTDVFMVSDDRFLRDMNAFAFDYPREVAVRTLQFTTSSAGFTQLWDRMALKSEGTYYQNLTGPESQTLQRAPAIDAWGQKLLGEHTLGDFVAQAVDYQRGSNVDGLRLYAEPSATLPLPLGRYAFGAVRASASETAYFLNETTVVGPSNPPSTEPSMSVLPRDQSRELVQVEGQAATIFDRVYAIHWLGLAKLKHTIEPTVEYLYIPAVSQTELPLFDGLDRVNKRNLFTYGLVSRFVGKFSEPIPEETLPGEIPPMSGSSGGAVRELARFSLFQSADISREIAPTSTGRVIDHFSNVDLAGDLYPGRALAMRFRTSYDVGNNIVSAARVGFFVQDPRRAPSSTEAPRLETRSSAGISYQLVTQGTSTGTQTTLQEVDDNIVLRVTDWAGLLYSGRFDVITSRFLGNYFGARLISTCDCWALDLALVNNTNPQELQFRVQLTLAGLGSSKQETRVAAAPF